MSTWDAAVASFHRLLSNAVNALTHSYANTHTHAGITACICQRLHYVSTERESAWGFVNIPLNWSVTHHTHTTLLPPLWGPLTNAKHVLFLLSDSNLNLKIRPGEAPAAPEARTSWSWGWFFRRQTWTRPQPHVSIISECVTLTHSNAEETLWSFRALLCLFFLLLLSFCAKAMYLFVFMDAAGDEPVIVKISMNL